MDYNRNLSESLAVLALINPVSQSAGTVTFGPIDLAQQRRVLALVQSGVIGTSVDAKFTACKTSGGTYDDVPGAAITQITASNKVAKLELRAESVESLLGSGYRYAKLSLTGVGTNLIGGVILGAVSRYEPNSLNDAAAVSSTVVV